MDALRRYHRQMLLPGFGEAGQLALRRSRVLLVGCGALGSVIADMLTRAGVGHLRVVDRDLVELTNLQRQVLFTEEDAACGTPKAVAAAERLAQVNAEVTVEPIVADFTHRNAEPLAADADLLLDGTDNFETRLLLNDLAVACGLPYVYGGAVGVSGIVYPILPPHHHQFPNGPHRASARESGDDAQPDQPQRAPWVEAGLAGPCLRCLLGDEPDTSQLGSCDTVGVLGPVAAIVANFEAAEAMKILTGNWRAVSRKLLSIDLMSNRVQQIDVAAGHASEACPCCGEGRFDYLEGRRAGRAATLCGRGAVQVQPAGGGRPRSLELDRLAQQLGEHGTARANDYVLQASFDDGGNRYRMTLFPDGRAVIHGTEDPAVARSLYARYVGV